MEEDIKWLQESVKQLQDRTQILGYRLSVALLGVALLAFLHAVTVIVGLAGAL